MEDVFDVPAPLDLEEILGGGSVRRFFRVKLPGLQSAVAMFAPAASHEIQKTPGGAEQGSFLEIRDLLENRGVRVPKLLGATAERSWILVEDLGQTLAQHLSSWPDRREALYQIAVRDLARAQRSLEPLPIGSIVRQRAFDQELLRLEIEHFRQWALDARGVELSRAERDAFDRAARWLASTISSWPRGFVHRDYQSRNLMVISNGQSELGLGWIDFQDAMLGPRVYDIVALLSDSYQEFSSEFVSRRLEEFSSYGFPTPIDRAQLGREFHLVTVQRKLKDAGRFVYFDRTQNNSSFLGYVESSVRKAQRALDALSDEPNLSELAELLRIWFPETEPK